MPNEASKSVKIGVSPPANEVERFHRYADTDSKVEAAHHTIGTRAYQAAAGSHNHQGGNGLPILDGVVFTGSKTLNTAAVLGQVINALVPLGAVDLTT